MCNKCNQTNTNTKCGGCNDTYQYQNICNECPPQPCDCPVVDLSTDCVLYNQDDILCGATVVVPKNTILSDALNLIITWVCSGFEEVKKYLRLKNVGTGAEIYAGDTLLGEKKLRTLTTTSSIITINQATDEIEFGIDTDELNDFVSISNVGTGVQSYKGFNSLTSTHEFRTVTTESLGMGESFLRDIQQNTNELNVRVKTLVSDNLSITSTDDEIRIETPTTAAIPALYVNNLYEPSYEEWLAENTIQNGGTPIVGFVFRGKGTLAQPFTDSVVYPLAGGSPTTTPNTAIQNALDGDTAYTTPYSYVGTDSRLRPSRNGEKIIIQSNNSSYTFTGDFGYSNIDVKIEGAVISTTTGYIIDMDNAAHFNALSDLAKIEVSKGCFLTVQGEGFKNDGTTVATNLFSQFRLLKLIGDGTIISTGTDITKYILTSDKTSSGNTTVGFYNDGIWHFEISCLLVSEFQGILAIGGKAQVFSFGGKFRSGSISSDVDINLKAFYLKGGVFKLQDNSKIILYGFNTTTRLEGITFESTNGFTATMYSSGTEMTGELDTLFNKVNTSNAILEFTSSNSGLQFYPTEVFNSPNLWQVIFKNNVFSLGNIDNTKVDLTFGNAISAINTIGNNVLEHLRSFTSKELARVSGMPVNSAYLLVRPVTATNLIQGTEYKVTTFGDGALGALGTYFIATGSETGTGVGSLIERCILI